MCLRSSMLLKQILTNRCFAPSVSQSLNDKSPCASNADLTMCHIHKMETVNYVWKFKFDSAWNIKWTAQWLLMLLVSFKALNHYIIAFVLGGWSFNDLWDCDLGRWSLNILVSRFISNLSEERLSYSQIRSDVLLILVWSFMVSNRE